MNCMKLSLRLLNAFDQLLNLTLLLVLASLPIDYYLKMKANILSVRLIIGKHTKGNEN